MAAVSFPTEDIMDSLKEAIYALLPDGFYPEAVFRLVTLVAVASVVLGCCNRVFFGKRSNLNHSISCALGILVMYTFTVLIDVFDPAGISKYLAPLPFVTFSGDYLMVFSFAGASHFTVAAELVNLLIISFLINLLDEWMPQGKNVVGWFLWKFLTVGLAMVLQLVVSNLMRTYLPGVLVTYAPTILLWVLILMLLLSVLKVMLGLLLVAVNPILAAVYAFFSTMVGRMLTKAVVTTVLLTALVYALDYFGFTLFCIAPDALLAYLPMTLILLSLWYLLGRVL